MTTKQIDYCIELAHTLNFSRAADNMFVSQPTFSYQIRLLEEEIGFTARRPQARDRAGAELQRQIYGQYLHLHDGTAGAVFPAGSHADLCRG